MHEKSKSFASLFEDLNGIPLQCDEETSDNMTLTDEMDHAILMHRDAHFGGDFEVMRRYYENDDHIGVDPELEYERICYLENVEKELGQNLAALFLSATEAEQIARCRQAYAQFRDLYDTEQGSQARLIADLILSEEEEPIEAIEAICQQGHEIVPLLIDLVRCDDAYLPLFPGYGYAPYLAAICLGKLGDRRALIPLFEIFHKQAAFDDEALLDAFADLGEMGKQFLLQQLQGRPITADNTHAAFALCVFAHDAEVAHVAITQLKDPVVHQHSLLATYLLSLCEALQHTPHKQELLALTQLPHLPKEVLLQIKTMVRDWQL